LKEFASNIKLVLVSMGNVSSEQQDTETCECGKSVYDESSCKYNPKLIGTVKKLYKHHIIICTGGTDWEPKIHKEHGSFAEKLHQSLSKQEDFSETVLVTNCSEKSLSTDPKQIDIIIFPQGIRYFGVTTEDLESLIKCHVMKDEVCSNIKHEKLPFQHLVLVCTHNSRDTRCGRIGPTVIDSLQQILKERNVGEDTVVVRACSHLGGHKYAAVLVVYPNGDWYGQMSTRNAEKLLDSYLGLRPPLTENWRGKMGETVEESRKRAEGRLLPSLSLDLLKTSKQ